MELVVSEKLALNNLDAMLTFAIVDPTLPDGMIFNVFAETEDKLPQIRNVGDIFRAHRIKVKRR